MRMTGEIIRNKRIVVIRGIFDLLSEKIKL